MFDPRELYFVTRVHECKKFGHKAWQSEGARRSRSIRERWALWPALQTALAT